MSKKQLIIISSFVTLLLPLAAYAVNCSAVPANEWIGCIMKNIIDIVVWPVFAGLVFIMFIWAGILFLIARGEPSKLETARKALIWAVVGIVVGILAFSAYAIIKWVLGL